MDRPTKEVLKLVPIFSKFDDESLEKLESFIEEKHYQKGDILFRENSFGDTFYIIKYGSVEIYKEGVDGEEKVILAMRRSGDFFGEMALLENSPRFATARVAANSQLLELSKAAFISLLYEIPVVAFEIMGVLAERLRQADLQSIKDLKDKNASLENVGRQLEESNRKLVRTKKFLEKIISVSPDIIVVTDRNGSIYIINSASQKIYGYDYEEVRGKNVGILHSPNCPAETLAELQKGLDHNEIFAGEVLDARKNGDEFINYLTACNIIGANDKHLGVLYLGKDITESKELERQAQALDRMAARGQMAAEVAHEMNNYISILSGNLELLSFDIEAGNMAGVGKKIDVMINALSRMTVFAQGLMSHAQPKHEFCEIELNRFLEAELAFLRPQKRYRSIQIITNFDERITTISADPAGLQQILYNLINNATDAISNAGIKNGIIEVKTVFRGDGEGLAIEVGDNGPGMSAEEQEKAFKHSFTTKTSGHGFGLLTIKSVAKIHNGKVSVQSEPGRGTRFIIALPLIPKLIEPVAQKSSAQLQESVHGI